MSQVEGDTLLISRSEELSSEGEPDVLVFPEEGTLVVSPEESQAIVAVAEEVVILAVVEESPLIAGKKGDKGDKGEPGLGLPAAPFEHVQSVASDTWVINHPLNRYPSVLIIDSAGDEVEASISRPSLTQVIITASAAFSGTAYLS